MLVIKDSPEIRENCGGNDSEMRADAVILITRREGGTSKSSWELQDRGTCSDKPVLLVEYNIEELDAGCQLMIRADQCHADHP